MPTTNEMIQCPECAGKKKLFGMFPRYADHVPQEQRKPFVEIDCPRCNGAGEVPAVMLQWMEQGKALKQERLVSGMGLREFCIANGVCVLVRSRRERGCIDPSTPDKPYGWPQGDCDYDD